MSDDDILHYRDAGTVLVKKAMPEIEVYVGKKVLVYNKDRDDWRKAEIIRVYDENTYRQEHYPDGLPEWDNGSYNDKLVDVRFLTNKRQSKAFFVWGLREIPDED